MSMKTENIEKDNNHTQGVIFAENFETVDSGGEYEEKKRDSCETERDNGGHDVTTSTGDVIAG